MNTLLLYDPRHAGHDPGDDHPESPLRLRSIESSLANLPSGVILKTDLPTATREQLLRVHTAAYLDRIWSAAGTTLQFDHETRMGPDSLGVILRASGACVFLVDALVDQTIRNGFALVRPPGHHASPEEASGYCIVNHIAVAACHAIHRGIRRVMVFDWDAHRGHGTQAAFSGSAQVAVWSVHQRALFPDQEHANAVSGLCRDIPLAQGAGDAQLIAAVDALKAAADAFAPELLLVSAGFDGHAQDPMSELNYSSEAFGMACRGIVEIAAQHSQGRLGLVLEGGYDSTALRDATMACLREMVR